MLKCVVMPLPIPLLFLFLLNGTSELDVLVIMDDIPDFRFPSSGVEEARGAKRLLSSFESTPPTIYVQGMQGKHKLSDKLFL